jgi:UDP-N-acetyl-D-glucosamine/UDP-N-acetyl-D-galactosamine dehydrogenase
MSLSEKIRNKKEKISIIGLGYVGLPLAIAFAKKVEVIGFDIAKRKIEQYLDGVDVTKEVGDSVLKKTKVSFSFDEKELQKAKFHIVAVPTPINSDKTPDLSPIIGASKTLGRNLTRGCIVVYESTVYPGVTEEICIPILEEQSGLKCGIDFKVGYSPERINPGDKTHRIENIVKVVSGVDEESLIEIATVYELIVEAGVYKAESIKVAEAAKVIENAQRDINIAFMNELSIVFNKLGINTKAVLEAAGTKWNFLNFTPGLVGGHCIGVDPYYLTYKAAEIGYHSQIILSGRRINDEMGKYVAENTVKKLIQANKNVKGSNVAVFGITFKENCPDCRNTKVIDIIRELEEYGVNVQVIDPVATAEEVEREYGIRLVTLADLRPLDAVIFAVAHEEFMSIRLQDLKSLYKNFNSDLLRAFVEIAATNEDEKEFSNKNVLIDVKGIFNTLEAERMNFMYWRL